MIYAHRSSLPYVDPLTGMVRTRNHGSVPAHLVTEDMVSSRRPGPSDLQVYDSKVTAAQEPVTEEAPLEKEEFSLGRLLRYMFFPRSLYSQKPLLKTAARVIQGKNYGHCLTPDKGEVTEAAQQAQLAAVNVVDQVGGKELKAQGVELKVNLYASDDIDVFAKEIPKGKSVWGYLKSCLWGSKPTPKRYEIGITAGALNKLQHEGELGFLTARAIGAIEAGHAAPLSLTNHGNLTASQSRTLMQDRKGFELMAKAGYDPALGLTCIDKLYSDTPSPDQDDSLYEGLRGGLGKTQSEGVRSAFGQLSVEYMRRTSALARPQTEHKKLADVFRLNLPDYTPEHPSREVCRALTKEYATGTFQIEWDAVPSPRGSLAREELLNAPWSRREAGEAFRESLKELDQAPHSPQEKGDRSLFLLHGLHASGWERGGPPELGEEGRTEFADFLSRQAQRGWKAEKFLDRLQHLGQESRSGSRAEPDFAHKVLLTPDVQAAVKTVSVSHPEVDKLYDALPDLLMVPRDEGADCQAEQVTAAVGVLAGQRQKDSFEWWRGWPSALPAGQGAYDDQNRTNLNLKLAELAQPNSPIDLATTDRLGSFTQKLRGLSDQSHTEPVLEALAPAADRMVARRDHLLATVDTDRRQQRELFETLAIVPVARSVAGEPDPAEVQVLKRMVNRGLESFSDKPFTEMPAWGELLGVSLGSTQFSDQEKDKIAGYMLSEMPTEGWRPDLSRPGLAHLKTYFESKSDEQLLGLLEAEIGRDGIGSPLGPDHDNANHSTPLLSLVGNDRELSQRLARAAKPEQLERWVGALRFDEDRRIDAGSRLFLLDTVIALQGHAPPITLDQWCDHLNTILDPFLLTLHPELKPKLGEFAHQMLDKQEPTDLRKSLKKEPVREMLSLKHQSDLFLKLLRPEDYKDKPVALKPKLDQLEEEFGLKGNNGLRRVLYADIAEQAHLQPGTIDKVLERIPAAVDDLGQGMEVPIRGMSALVAATRTRPPLEQMAVIEYLMGRNDELPPFVGEMNDDLMGIVASYDPRLVDELRSNKTNLSVVFEGARNYLKDADMIARTAVTGAFLSGPNGLLNTESGRTMLLDQYLDQIPESEQGFARQLATAMVDAQGTVRGVTVGYLLAQKTEAPQAGEGPDGGEGKKLSEVSPGKILHHIFSAYGVPGKKFEQYFAFAEQFAEYSEDFEDSQDKAEDINYHDAVRLIQHHYGDTWPDNREVVKVIGCGSVNLAVIYKDENGELGVVSMPKENVEIQAHYDFHRLRCLVQQLLSHPENRENFGFLEGLLDITERSVNLEFDRKAAFEMQKSVENFYTGVVNGWRIHSVRARALEGVTGQAITMDLAKGKTGVHWNRENPEVYRDAMGAMAQKETDALLGLHHGIRPKPLHANPDFHNGQVLIDPKETVGEDGIKGDVYILDFGQAVNITVDERDYAMEMATIMGGVHKPEKAAKLLSERSGLQIPTQDMERIMSTKDPMDIFIKTLGYLGNHGSQMPVSTVHWVLGINRQRVLAPKIGVNFERTLKGMGASFLFTDSLTGYNTYRVARRTVSEVIGNVGGWFSGKAADDLEDIQ